MINFIRYSAFVCGIVFSLYLLGENVSESRSFIGQLAVTVFYIMLPFYLYLLITRKTMSLFKLILPAAGLIVVYFILVREYFNSDPATSGLVFITIPIAGIIVLLALFGLSVLIIKIFNLKS